LGLTGSGNDPARFGVAWEDHRDNPDRCYKQPVEASLLRVIMLRSERQPASYNFSTSTPATASRASPASERYGSA
jgi:hypothetical protein